MPLSKEYFQFFKELENNNNKEWFDENRSRYKKYVREPFVELTSNIISEIGMIDPKVTALNPKNAIFRINRDIRFSKDKTLYKNYMAAVISPKGRKDKSYPGLYYEINKNSLIFYGGAYTPDKDDLRAIRMYIAENPDKFNEALEDKDFKKSFGSLLEVEKHKRIDKDLKDAAKTQPLIFNKSFVYNCSVKLTPDDYNNIEDLILLKYKASEPMLNFLKSALNLYE